MRSLHDRAEILAGDYAQEFLMPHLLRTEELLRVSLRSLAASSECQIVPAADLCLPHDVIRIAGGFATGCIVDWQCDVPIIPIDTTVNIDTSSIFWLSDDVSDVLTQGDFDQIRQHIDEDSSYEWNFHKGNHFIALVHRLSDGRSGLVIHSNEKEFKYQFNGLMPVRGNWFMDDVEVFRRGSSYIRLLIGRKAELFFKIAKDLEAFSINRHRFVAMMVLGKKAYAVEEYHKHHYLMPNSSCVAMGCYLCTAGEIVPIFSRPGSDIHLFQCTAGGQNEVRLLNGESHLLVPHGWGKTAAAPVEVVFDEDLFTINGQSFEVEPKVSLGSHPGLVLRDFAPDASSATSLFAAMRHHTPGRVVDVLRQVCAYNKNGFTRFEADDRMAPM